MSLMRGRRLTAVSLLMGASLLVTLFCPCAMVPSADAGSHGCCPIEAGVRASSPSCCAATAAPEQGTSTPAAAGPTVPAPPMFVLATLTAASAGRVMAEASQAFGVAGAPPLVLRI